MEAAQESIIFVSRSIGLSTRPPSHCCGFVVWWIDCPLLSLGCVGLNPGVIETENDTHKKKTLIVYSYKKETVRSADNNTTESLL